MPENSIAISLRRKIRFFFWFVIFFFPGEHIGSFPTTSGAQRVPRNRQKTKFKTILCNYLFLITFSNVNWRIFFIIVTRTIFFSASVPLKVHVLRSPR